MPPHPPQDFPELELLAASLRGDVSAYTRLVERYERLVWSVALCATGAESLAEELAQEAFITAWSRLPELRDLSKFRSWLCGIVRNHARTARRHAERHIPDLDRRVEMIEMPSERPTPLDAVIDDERQRQLDDAIAGLPDSYREPLVLFYGEQLCIREIAELLDVSEQTVRQRLSRGRKQLRVGLAAAVVAAISVPIREAVAAPVASSLHLPLAVGFGAVSTAIVAALVVIGSRGSWPGEEPHAGADIPVSATRSPNELASHETPPPHGRRSREPHRPTGRVVIGTGKTAPRSATTDPPAPRARASAPARAPAPARTREPQHTQHPHHTEVRHGPAVIDRHPRRPIMRPSVTVDDIR